MLPSAFVMLDSLPLTANGKVDRKALPPPDQSRPDQAVSFVEPSTATEKKIAEIWAQLLKVDLIGIRDNFFDLGGHSLLATRLISRLRQTFHMDIPLRSLFENPTVAELAAEIAQIQAKHSMPKIAELLADLESLSEEDAQRLVTEPNLKDI
jgi:acyl carrier protein